VRPGVTVRQCRPGHVPEKTWVTETCSRMRPCLQQRQVRLRQLGQRRPLNKLSWTFGNDINGLQAIDTACNPMSSPCKITRKTLFAMCKKRKINKYVNINTIRRQTI
jgi:hypothetical protein